MRLILAASTSVIIGIFLGFIFFTSEEVSTLTSIPNEENVSQINTDTYRFLDKKLGLSFLFPKEARVHSQAKHSLTFFGLDLSSDHGGVVQAENHVSVLVTDGTNQSIYELNFSDRHTGYPATPDTLEKIILLGGEEQRVFYQPNSQRWSTSVCDLSLTIQGDESQAKNILDTVECI